MPFDPELGLYRPRRRRRFRKAGLSAAAIVAVFACGIIGLTLRDNLGTVRDDSTGSSISGPPTPVGQTVATSPNG